MKICYRLSYFEAGFFLCGLAAIPFVFTFNALVALSLYTCLANIYFYLLFQQSNLRQEIWLLVHQNKGKLLEAQKRAQKLVPKTTLENLEDGLYTNLMIKFWGKQMLCFPIDFFKMLFNEFV